MCDKLLEWFELNFSKLLDCPPTHKLRCLETDNLILTDVRSQTAFTQTRTSQAPINIEERPAV